MIKNPQISFEFYPPKTDAGFAKLWETMHQLSPLKPNFVSVTCGAGGSSISGTAAIVTKLRGEFGVEVAPHVAIARQRASSVREALKTYKNLGVRHVVAIRGDMVENDEDPGDDIYPNTVDFVAELHDTFGLNPIVAAYPDVHPRALSPQQDLDHLKKKVAAGAWLAISQFFFTPETFLRFRDKLAHEGISIKLAAGIMPISNLSQVIKFAQGCGTIVPDKFAERFDRHGDDEKAIFAEGVAHASKLCNQLRQEGVDHFHFYSLNRSDMTLAICKELGLGSEK